MSDSNQRSLTEDQVLLSYLQEIFQVISENLDNVSDKLKEITEFFSESKENGTLKELAQTFHVLFSKIVSKKRTVDVLLNALLGSKDFYVEQPISNVPEIHLEEDNGMPNDTEGKYSMLTRPFHTNDPIPVENKHFSLYDLDVSTVDKLKKFLRYEIQNVTPSILNNRDSKTVLKDIFEIPDGLSSMLKITKIQNLSIEDKGIELLKAKDNVEKAGFRFFPPIYKSVTVQFKLENGQQHSDENGIFKTHNAVFRNISATDLFTNRITPDEVNTRNESYRGTDDIPIDNPNNSANVVLMPCDIRGNNDIINEIRNFLSMSTNNSVSVRIPENFTVEHHKETELVVEITVHQSSRKPLKRQFTLQMHVVTSDMFESAIMDSQIHTLELTYTNIFPRDCRMFIALPIYRDGFLNRKDQLDINET